MTGRPAESLRRRPERHTQEPAFRIDTGEIPGVWCPGTRVTDPARFGQAAPALDGSFGHFLTGVLDHPTLAECSRLAALVAFDSIRVPGDAAPGSASPTAAMHPNP